MLTTIQIVLGIVLLIMIYALYHWPIASGKDSIKGLPLILGTAAVALFLGISLTPRIAPIIGVTAEEQLQIATINPPDPATHKVSWDATGRKLSFPDAPASLKWMVQPEGAGPTVVLDKAYVVPPGATYVLVYYQQDKPIPTASGAIIVATR